MPSRREAIKVIFPGGWALDAKDAKSLDPAKWSRFGQAGFLKDLMLVLPGCAPKIIPPTTLQPEAIETAVVATPGVEVVDTLVVQETIPTAVPEEREWSPGQPGEKVRLEVIGPDNERSMVEIVNFTKIGFNLNGNTFVKFVSFCHQQGGVLPPKAEIWFVEKDLPCTPEIPAMIIEEQDLMVLSLGRLLRHPEELVPEGYKTSDVANDVMAGQWCCLMFLESQEVNLGGKPQTVENKRLVSTSYMSMVAAIMAGRDYQEFMDDLTNKIWGMEQAELIQSDIESYQETYQVFEEIFQEPLLIFEQTLIPLPAVLDV